MENDQIERDYPPTLEALNALMHWAAFYGKTSILKQVADLMHARGFDLSEEIDQRMVFYRVHCRLAEIRASNDNVAFHDFLAGIFFHFMIPLSPSSFLIQTFTLLPT